MENGTFKGFDGISTEALYEMGRAAGFLAAALVAGYFQGQRDFDAYAEQAAATTTPPTEEAEGGVCAHCWCNTCAKLEVCDAFATSDGLRPAPCAECNAKDEAPLMPRSRPAECGTYEEMPRDCRACWCKVCANFEECVVDNPDYDPESKPCPCDGCKAGKQYMPKAEPPTCGRYEPLKKTE